MFQFLKSFAVVCCLSFVSFLLPAEADSGDWQLSDPKGVVRVMLPGAAITKGRDAMSLPVGTVITTGRDSSAVMIRGEQKIDVAADTRLTISENAQGLTRIRQDTGVALYQVDSRAMPHFRVDTTLLAAVVKGTGFTVSAGPDAHVVHVAHGLVEVRMQQGEGASDVRPGETARVERATPFDIKVERPSEASVTPKTINIPAIDYADASNNLLQPIRGPAQTGNRDSQGLRGEMGASQDPGAGTQQGMNATAVLAALNGSANGNGSGNGNGNGNGSENGNGNGNGSENGNGNGNGSENGNGNGNGSGNGNGNGSENGNGNGNGSENGNGNGNVSGNGNGNGNGNGSENGNGNGNGSENGNGSGNGSENGNGNGNGSENGNGNGNGSENGNGNGNGSENGNGNGNGSGNGNGNGSENGGGNGGGDLPTPPGRGPKP